MKIRIIKESKIKLKVTIRGHKPHIPQQGRKTRNVQNRQTRMGKKKKKRQERNVTDTVSSLQALSHDGRSHAAGLTSWPRQHHRFPPSSGTACLGSRRGPGAHSTGRGSAHGPPSAPACSASTAAWSGGPARPRPGGSR